MKIINKKKKGEILVLTIQISNCQLLSDHDLVAPAFRNTPHDGQMAQSSFTLPQGGKEKTSIIDTLARWDLWCPWGGLHLHGTFKLSS